MTELLLLRRYSCSLPRKSEESALKIPSETHASVLYRNKSALTLNVMYEDHEIVEVAYSLVMTFLDCTPSIHANAM